MFRFLMKRKWRLRFWNMLVLYSIFFLLVNAFNLKKENVKLFNENIDKTKRLVATQDVLTNLNDYYPGLGSGAEEIIKAALDEDYDKEKIAEPLIDNIVKVNTKLHGLTLYNQRFGEFIFPIAFESVQYAFVSSEFVDARKVEYSYWKKKHYKFLYQYSEDDRKIIYASADYKFDGEWVVNEIRYETHYAIDICSSYGDDIVASADGIVERCGWSDAGGYYILVRHYTANKIIKYSYYGHLSSIKVVKDQIVGQGEIIGAMGQTGNEQTGKHVHFALFSYDLKTKQCIYDNPTTATTFYGRKIKDSSI